MKDVGVETYLIPSEETTYSRVLHESANVDERKLTLVKSAGVISINDVPELDSTCVHLAGHFGHRIRHAAHEGPESREGTACRPTCRVLSAMSPR